MQEQRVDDVAQTRRTVRFRRNLPWCRQAPCSTANAVVPQLTGLGDLWTTTCELRLELIDSRARLSRRGIEAFHEK